MALVEDGALLGSRQLDMGNSGLEYLCARMAHRDKGMPKNYWMVVQTPENFERSKERGFTIHGLKTRQRRRAQRMEPDDRVLFYVSGLRKWTAIASIASRYFEDRSPIWDSGPKGERYPYRVKLSPSIVLDERDYIDALELGPRLEYVKRWPPESWPLAFHDTLHLLPQRDFRLIEAEMKKIVSGRRRRRRRGRHRGDGRGGRPSEGRSQTPGQDGGDSAREGEGEAQTSSEGRSETVAGNESDSERKAEDQPQTSGVGRSETVTDNEGDSARGAVGEEQMSSDGRGQTLQGDESDSAREAEDQPEISNVGPSETVEGGTAREGEGEGQNSEVGPGETVEGDTTRDADGEAQGPSDAQGDALGR